MTGVVASVGHSATGPGIRIEPLEGAGRGACGLLGLVDAGNRYYRRTASGGRVPVSLAAIDIGSKVQVYPSDARGGPCREDGPLSALVLVSRPRASRRQRPGHTGLP